MRRNGDVVAPRVDDTYAPMQGQPIAVGAAGLAPETITVLAGPDAEQVACR